MQTMNCQNTVLDVFICPNLVDDDKYRWKELWVQFTHAGLKTKKGTGIVTSYTLC